MLCTVFLCHHGHHGHTDSRHNSGSSRKERQEPKTKPDARIRGCRRSGTKVTLKWSHKKYQVQKCPTSDTVRKSPSSASGFISGVRPAGDVTGLYRYERILCIRYPTEIDESLAAPCGHCHHAQKEDESSIANTTNGRSQVMSPPSRHIHIGIFKSTDFLWIFRRVRIVQSH
jgi:hypothetical protein